MCGVCVCGYVYCVCVCISPSIVIFTVYNKNFFSQLFVIFYSIENQNRPKELNFEFGFFFEFRFVFWMLKQKSVDEKRFSKVCQKFDFEFSFFLFCCVSICCCCCCSLLLLFEVCWERFWVVSQRACVRSSYDYSLSHSFFPYIHLSHLLYLNI